MKKSYKILIAEDDALISESLKEHLISSGQDVIGIASTLDEVIELIKFDPEFCFLDIRMHGKDEGFVIADYLNTHTTVPFLFLTSFGDLDTISKASKYKPAGYLTKPYKPADILSALQIAMAKVEMSIEEKIQIKDGAKNHYLHPSDILFCKADNVYVEIHTVNKKYLERISLDKFSERLPPSFKKCHRSYVVNIHAITSVSSVKLTVQGHEIPLSRTYKASF